MSTTTAQSRKTPFFIYYEEIIRLHKDEGHPILKINANMLKGIGGHYERRKEAIAKFHEIYLDEQGNMIELPVEIDDWAQELIRSVLGVRALAMGASRAIAKKTIADLEHKIQTQKNELTEQYEKVTSLSEDVLTATTERNETLAQLQELKTELVSERTYSEEQARKRTESEAQVKDLETKNLELVSLLEKAQMSNEALSRDKDVLTLKNTELSQKLEVRGNEVISLNHKANELEKKAIIDENTIERLNKDVRTLENSNAQVQREIKELNEKIASYKESDNKLQTELSDSKLLTQKLELQVEELKELTDKQSQKVESLESNAADLHQQISTLTIKLENATNQNKTYENLLTNINSSKA